MSKVKSAEEAVRLIADNAVIAVNSSSGLCCPDAVLQALGARFDAEKHPKNITSIHPIAAGDMFGSPGTEHIAKPGMLAKIIGGSYISGPTKADPPKIWQMISANQLAAYNVPSGIVFDMLREGAANAPGFLLKWVGNICRPALGGCAMNEMARQDPIVRVENFEDEEWLFFKSLIPNVSIIRGSVADARGNLNFGQEGAYLGAMEMALAARNNGGLVIAQVRRIAKKWHNSPARCSRARDSGRCDC